MPDTAKPWRHLRWCLLAAALALMWVETHAVPAGAQSSVGKESQKKEILIKTPWGGIEAAATSDASRLGLPVYPGARVPRDEGAGTVSLDLTTKDKPDVHFLVGKFETPDAIEKVRDFYHNKLGKAVTKFVEKTDEGGMAFEMKGKSESKYVQLKSVGGGTEIDLLRVAGLQDQDKHRE
jgi:hypothetical protein